MCSSCLVMMFEGCDVVMHGMDIAYGACALSVSHRCVWIPEGSALLEWLWKCGEIGFVTYVC